MGRRLKRKRGRRQQQRAVARTAAFFRSLFSSGPAAESDDPRDIEGGLGVRKPRKPLHPSMSGAVALETPPADTRDVWAVGDDDRG